MSIVRPPVRVDFLIESMEALAGMERVTATIATGLHDRGYRVRIVCLRGTGSAFPLPGAVPLMGLGFPQNTLRLRSETLPILRSVRRHVLSRPPDVMVAVDSFLAPFVFPALLGSGIRRIAWEHFNLHTTLNMRSRQLARPIAAALSDDILTLTAEDADAWKRAFPWTRARIRAMPNPLPVARPAHNPYASGGSARRLVLGVGRLDRQKGFDRLLEAWALVETDFPEWALAIYGEGPDRDALSRQAKRLNLSRVSFRPPTPDIHAVYDRTGVYALSSRHEGLPMVLLESQAQGIPAVAFDCRTGPAEILQGGGQLIPNGDTVAFAQALGRLLGDAAIRDAMSTRAHESAVRYDAPRILNAWQALLG